MYKMYKRYHEISKTCMKINYTITTVIILFSVMLTTQKSVSLTWSHKTISLRKAHQHLHFQHLCPHIICTIYSGHSVSSPAASMSSKGTKAD